MSTHASISQHSHAELKRLTNMLLITPQHPDQCGAWMTLLFYLPREKGRLIVYYASELGGPPSQNTSGSPAAFCQKVSKNIGLQETGLPASATKTRTQTGTICGSTSGGQHWSKPRGIGLHMGKKRSVTRPL